MYLGCFVPCFCLFFSVVTVSACPCLGLFWGVFWWSGGGYPPGG